MYSGLELAGRYRLDVLLGRGGMAQVWQATDDRLGRDVAIKLVPYPVGMEPELAVRLRREAQITAGLQHPGITVVYDTGEHQQMLYVVMELLQGRPLSHVLKSYPQGLNVFGALYFAEQVTGALAVAHKQNIVHRDIKPANLMVLNERGRVKICDFGIARFIEVSAGLAGNRIAGNPAYMAPEQFRGGPVDARTDLYALGCVFHHMLTGRPPFPDDRGVDALMRAHLTSAPPRPRDLQPRLPVELDRLTTVLLAKNPADRPSNAAELSEHFRDLRLRLAAGPLPPPAPHAAAAPAEAAEPAAPSTSTPSPERSSAASASSSAASTASPTVSGPSSSALPRIVMAGASPAPTAPPRPQRPRRPERPQRPQRPPRPARRPDRATSMPARGATGQWGAVTGSWSAAPGGWDATAVPSPVGGERRRVEPVVADETPVPDSPSRAGADAASGPASEPVTDAPGEAADAHATGGTPRGAAPTRGRRGDDMETDVTIELVEAVNGAVIPLRLTHDESCRECSGYGLSNNRICPECGGRGTFTHSRTIQVRIPAGVRDRQRIRVKGQGAKGIDGGPPGDLYLMVHVQPHKVFGRRGDDLTITVPMSYEEATKGGDIKIPVLGDPPISLHLPPATPNGRTFRLRQWGVGRQDGTRGDLLVTMEVHIPRGSDANADELREELIQSANA